MAKQDRIKKFESTNVKSLRLELQAALAAVEQRHDIKIEVGYLKYHDTFAEYKVEVAVKADDGTALTKEIVLFNKWCQNYGLKSEQLGMTFVGKDGRNYRLNGMNTSSRGPFNATCLSDNRDYKLPESWLGLKYNGGTPSVASPQ